MLLRLERLVRTMTYRKRRPTRVHLTNGKENAVKVIEGGNYHKETTIYAITYCGESFATFGGKYEHSVYHFSQLTTLLESRCGTCPYCMESEELGLDLLGAS